MDEWRQDWLCDIWWVWAYDWQVTGDGTDFQSGVTQSGGSLTVTGADLGTGVTNAGGSVSVTGATPATTTGDVTNTGGDLTIAAGQTLEGVVANNDLAVIELQKQNSLGRNIYPWKVQPIFMTTTVRKF